MHINEAGADYAEAMVESEAIRDRGEYSRATGLHVAPAANFRLSTLDISIAIRVTRYRKLGT